MVEQDVDAGGTWPPSARCIVVLGRSEYAEGDSQLLRSFPEGPTVLAVEVVEIIFPAEFKSQPRESLPRDQLFQPVRPVGSGRIDESQCREPVGESLDAMGEIPVVPRIDAGCTMTALSTPASSIRGSRYSTDAGRAAYLRRRTKRGSRRPRIRADACR